MSESERASVVGNRWVLTGAVLYLLEWVAIIAGQVSVRVTAGPPVRCTPWTARRSC